MNVGRRAYRGIADDRHIRDLLSRNFAATGHPYYSVDVPNWERFSAAARTGSAQHEIQLWELAEHSETLVVALLEYHLSRRKFSCLIDPQHLELAAELVEWVEGFDQDRAADQNEPNVLSCSVCDKNESQLLLLSRVGYSKGQQETIFHSRSMVKDIQAVPLPAGYHIVELESLTEGQFAERVSAEFDIFGDRTTAEFLNELQLAPIYRPKFDLVVTAPDQSVAAFCTVWLDALNHAGYFEPVATLPSHRRKGLAQAMMVEGLHRLQMIGAKTAFLGHDVGNSAAIKLYQSVGMEIFDQEYLWFKQ